jgi:hypothetical protein
LSYEDVVREALAKGHDDPGALRELLIATAMKPTYEAAMAYFRQHMDDAALLKRLFAIAAEGEDMGDAPWAAANVIEEFPPELLKPHEQELQSLAEHPWMYLHVPARRALAKLKASAL